MNMPIMAISAASHPSLHVLIVLSVFSVLVEDVRGRHHACPPFSCGGLTDLSYPFRRRGDLPMCGLQPFELVCTETNATIHIGSGIYYVVSINYTRSYFWVVDATLDMQSSCLLPWWDYKHRSWGFPKRGVEFLHHSMEFSPYEPASSGWATFVNCTQKLNSASYLAMTPLGDITGITVPGSASYEDVVKFMKKGFALNFVLFGSYSDRVSDCLADSITDLHEEPRNSSDIKFQILEILQIDFYFWLCITQELRPINIVTDVLIIIIPPAMWVLKAIHVLYRFVLTPLAVSTFLAHKYWKTRIKMDAVEMFLQMQQMLSSPLRYAYTDITAITGHFREKLGQGGYGSVYKGVILLGNAHVAVKMLSNSKCNGEEFISEVSTIGSIHHVNVVRLVGFCSEEMRRALVYEYMPNGSLDKYIFSSERNFSWDKLNEIALGIARGIN
ncbi:hypothetical protein QOZ80_1BG0055950 [Eleusine coracana subsp. coracana]|nr:hypothetical protein QOZ80_1BG0055950 [Eleusine coracana subsp. coracana]